MMEGLLCMRRLIGGHKETAVLLIAKGADVNAKNDTGATPLHYTSAEGRKEAAELLIAAGADVNAKEVNGETPLHAAAVHGHNQVVELLIGAGADVNAKTESLLSNLTPLHGATLKGHKEIAELLISNDANVNAKTDGGKTPLDWAISRKYPEIADLLRKHGGKTGEELKAE